MRLVDGLWWPAEDKHAREAIIGTLQDVDQAVDRCRGRKACIQAGGSCGVWANHLAQHFEQVWTIEPDLENYLCLLRNINNQNVKPIWAALGDKRQIVGMVRDPQNIGAHRVSEGSEVLQITIDDLQLEACDLIVLDIEGLEQQALHGARDTIEKFKPVLMVEDKGQSELYGVPREWSLNIPGYEVVKRIHRDTILVPA